MTCQGYGVALTIARGSPPPIVFGGYQRWACPMASLSADGDFAALPAMALRCQEPSTDFHTDTRTETDSAISAEPSPFLIRLSDSRSGPLSVCPPPIVLGDYQRRRSRWRCCRRTMVLPRGPRGRWQHVLELVPLITMLIESVKHLRNSPVFDFLNFLLL